MSTVKTEYYADELEDIALKFDEEAANSRNTAALHPRITLRDKRYYTGKAESLEYAARILRQTTMTENQRLRELVLTGEAVVNDFMPNISKCVLQDYGRLNEFLLEAGKLKNGS